MKELVEILKSDVIIIGLYPPPPGGIGIHIERLAHYLKREDIKFHVFNHGNFRNEFVTPTNRSYFWWINFFIYNLRVRRKLKLSRKLFHFHVLSFLHYPFLLLFSKLVTDNILITIHNENFFLYPFLKKLSFLFLIKRISCKRVISVSKKINDMLISESVNSIFLNAYISIPYKKKRISKNIKFFYIAMNMWRFTKDQIYRYGADLVFSYMKEFPDKYKLHIYVSDENKSVSLKSLTNEFKFLDDIHNDVNIIFGRNLIEYIGNYDIFFRPNRSDGFGVSILEALYSGIPVIASDTCVRPEGCIQFKSGDYESFKQKIKLIEGRETKINFPREKGNQTKIMEMYKEFLGEK